MSPKLPVVKAKDLLRVVNALGYVLDRQKGSNAVYYRKKDATRIVIPIHAGVDLKPGTLSGIISDMGLTVEEFINLL
ncbi:MAG: type II toxin-antitoxin system HicA family toxin [Candidatus Xenobiia bacterium LiM19]